MIRIVFWTNEDSSIEATWPVVPMPGDRVYIGGHDYITLRREFNGDETGMLVVHVILAEIK